MEKNQNSIKYYLNIRIFVVELRKEIYKNWRKKLPFQAVNMWRFSDLTVCSKVRKPPHNVKIHVWAGISRDAPTKIIIFTSNLKGPGYRRILQYGLLPFFRKFPFGHRLLMDNAPSHTCGTTKSFMDLNEINRFPTPAQSPVENML